jgi:hypothetical protein
MADVTSSTVVNALCNQGDLTITTPTTLATSMVTVLNHVRNNRPGHIVNLVEYATGGQLAVVKDSGVG